MALLSCQNGSARILRCTDNLKKPMLSLHALLSTSFFICLCKLSWCILPRLKEMGAVSPAAQQKVWPHCRATGGLGLHRPHCVTTSLHLLLPLPHNMPCSRSSTTGLHLHPSGTWRWGHTHHGMSNDGRSQMVLADRRAAPSTDVVVGMEHTPQGYLS